MTASVTVEVAGDNAGVSLPTGSPGCGGGRLGILLPRFVTRTAASGALKSRREGSFPNLDMR